MKTALTALALALAACAPQSGPARTDGMAALDNMADAPSAAVASGKGEAMMTNDPLIECDGGKANALLGQTVDDALRGKAMRLVGAATVRVIPPGAMVTMDYRGNRLNIETDAQNRATRFRCG